MNVQTIIATAKKAETKMNAAFRAATKAGEVASLAAARAIKAMPCETYKDIDARDAALDRLRDLDLEFSDACYRVFDAIERQHVRVDDAIWASEMDSGKGYRSTKGKAKGGKRKMKCGRGRG
ncbi:hypothetical protein [Bradyrhizobium erythrophlei]|uniref:Uncharacterized protein n=1 Tax=Bradyrhizobium erythrophlei TaxID=1437360 RepID=A0A1M5NIX6_9BRAD|nr:hypothetical protein [Bradyrhizobium erythrophlei]SHG89468.1 hypothetical protein SAMN05443248_3014 [Bradyrhizobium erythrophlei]